MDSHVVNMRPYVEGNASRDPSRPESSFESANGYCSNEADRQLFDASARQSAATPFNPTRMLEPPREVFFECSASDFVEEHNFPFPRCASANAVLDDTFKFLETYSDSPTNATCSSASSPQWREHADTESLGIDQDDTARVIPVGRAAIFHCEAPRLASFRVDRPLHLRDLKNPVYVADAASVLELHFEEDEFDPNDANGGRASEVYPLSAIKAGSNGDQYKSDGAADRETLFFRDGQRKIDFVLVFRVEDDEEGRQRLEKRKFFQECLHKDGLQLEVEEPQASSAAPSSAGNLLFRCCQLAAGDENKIGYVKIHAPFEVLLATAEKVKMKLPIERNDYHAALLQRPMRQCWDKMPNPFKIKDSLLEKEDEYFTAPFSRSSKVMYARFERLFDKFRGSKEKYFSNAERSWLTYEILARAIYEPPSEEAPEGKSGIDRTITNGTYMAAYPLHDGPWRLPNGHSVLIEGKINDRHALYWEWARPARWYKFQPIHSIRNYFGEKVALYFAWLGFYTQMLIPAAVVGIVVFLYGLATLFTNEPTAEICDENGVGSTPMCPLCTPTCTYWRLSKSCSYARATYVFDNPATVFFSVFMSFWAVFFLEFWKRQQAKLEFQWDLTESEGSSERIRPDFERIPTRRPNVVTGETEPYVHPFNRATRLVFGTSVVLLMVCLVLAAVFGVIIYRIIVLAVLSSQENTNDVVRNYAKLATTITAALINLVTIIVLGLLYKFIARKLTDWELHRTDSEYEDSFTVKMYMFQFVNNYASIFYVAFFKGSVFGASIAASKKERVLGMRGEECDPAGCLIELCIQLAIIMIGKQLLNNFTEIIIPAIRTGVKSWRARKLETTTDKYMRWEQDNDLQAVGTLTLFEEYLEMVIQFGFTTMFVAAFPLAPFFALLNNIIEIRLDAFKFVTQMRRPIAQKVNDIGVWYGILRIVAIIAVLTNAFIISYTSDFIPKMVYKYVYSYNQTGTAEPTLRGYIDFSLSLFDVNEFDNDTKPSPVAWFNGTFCHYRDYRSPPSDVDRYEHNIYYWHIFTVRLAFVVLFEHFIFFVVTVISWLIPDVPANIKSQIRREQYLAQKAFWGEKVDSGEQTPASTGLRQRNSQLQPVNYLAT